MINRKLVETPVRMMNRMEEITDLICEYNEEVQKQQQEIERLNNIIKEVREYIEENTNSDSPIKLTSGKITDIGYCIVAFEDILEILNKGE